LLRGQSFLYKIPSFIFLGQWRLLFIKGVFIFIKTTPQKKEIEGMSRKGNKYISLNLDRGGLDKR